MRKKKEVARNLLFVVFCLFSLWSCKNSNNNSDSWFSGFSSPPPATAEDVQEALITIASSEELFSSEDLEEFYAKRNYAPVWKEEDNTTTFLEELEKAEEEGLSPADYHGVQLQELLNNSDDLSPEERAKLELLLTDSFFKYGHDLFYGKTDPKQLYSLWGVYRKQIKLDSILDNATANTEIDEALQSLKPTNEIYTGLKKSLEEYRELKEKDTLATSVPEGKALEPGEKDERITQLATRLKQLGFLDKDYSPVENTYDDTLEAAIKKLQSERGLEADGIIGSTTLRAMNMTDTDRYNKILVNLERWRWYPRDLGEHYIMVNIPDFTLSVIKDGDTVRKHNVVAGSKARPTIVFTDTLQYIVINPTWNIPPTIQRQDVIPKASSNPSYLRNNNMTVTAPDGEQLDPGSIDWSSPEVKNYRFSQSAGPSNPLGRVKIIYPNQYLIYLHDTPAQGLFERNDRAESSGCVRVEDAVDLSAYVVNNQEDWNQEKIEQTIANGRTTQVEITQPIQVHHFYWTSWRADGKTIFADDVYDLDAEVFAALQQTD